MADALDDPSDRELIENTHPSAWQNPRPQEKYNLVIVGAGTAGLVCAAGAAGLGARVALIEKHRLGGDCLHHGCVPSKALLRCGREAAAVRRAGALGVRVEGPIEIDFPAMMQRMRRLRAGISHRDSATRFRELGVDVFLGEPCFTGRDMLKLAGDTLRFDRAVIATGTRPATLQLPGVDGAGFLTSETVFDLRELPRRFVVVGGGPMGCELGQAFRRLGSEVDLLHHSAELLPREEPETRRFIREQLEREGVRLHLGAKVIGVERDASETVLRVDRDGQMLRVRADAILLAIGRAPNVEELGLQQAGVEVDARGVKVNDYLQTTNPRIYAAGDVCSPFKFTHAADAMARIVLRNALFFDRLPVGRGRVSRLVIPWCTYTDPEIAHAGLTAEQAAERSLAIRTFRQELAEVDRAVLDGETNGFAMMHVRDGSDEIVGATIVARHAGEMIGEVALAMTRKLGLSALAETIHPYPTQAEVLRRLGDDYQRSRLTPRRVALLRTLFRWWR
jgi:pyruvate/2-oxoglutarate dehydrogenase complex dihydrolipoamide dehydrogenase (E3) component